MTYMDQEVIENPCIKPVSKLLGENFYIPRYQRGYRWGKQEITELLDDILQYYQGAKSNGSDKKVGNFYCLQPFVVKFKKWINASGKEITGWEVIDGQQRLTSLYIILSYLEEIRTLYDDSKEIYSIDFETRDNCKSFFENKEFKDKINDTNIDFYHISKAYAYVKDWFQDKPKLRIEILKTILNTENNVSIIWYEAKSKNEVTNEESNSIDQFTRLNEGKIALTDSELIKALLLQADIYPTLDKKYVDQRLFEIASEWDDIEASLQNPEMWCFLNEPEYQPSSKIEFIFSFLSESWNQKFSLVNYDYADGKPNHFEYLVFDRYLRKLHEDFLNNKDPEKDIMDPINSIWKDIKELYGVFNEWYSDHTLYHYIGYLLAIDNTSKRETLNTLISRKDNKNDFRNFLISKIAETIKIRKRRENSSDYKDLSELTYEKDNREIIKILLLFNITELVNCPNENSRFPFHLYKKENITSIEHIHPQNPDEIDTDEERSKVWMFSHKKTLLILKDESDKDFEIDQLIDNLDIVLASFDKEEFRTIFAKIIDFYTVISGIKEFEKHTLYNLALVDKDTNSSLNNSFFDVKRDILRENKYGKYIPICTQRVFSKYYTSQPQEMIFWSDNDRKAYFAEIKKMYDLFTNNLTSNHNGNN